MNVNAEICIVCDDVSKPAANALCNKLSNRHTGIVWNEKEYRDSKSSQFKSMSNRQKVLYMSQDLIRENLPKSQWEDSFVLAGNTKLVRIGNQYGIEIGNPEGNAPFLTKKEWWKYLISLVACGALSIFVALKLWERRKDDATKAMKESLYEGAVGSLIKEGNIKKLFPE